MIEEDPTSLQELRRINILSNAAETKEQNGLDLVVMITGLAAVPK